MDVGPCYPRRGLDTEKKTLGATERDEVQRQAFCARVAARSVADFVVVDETGSNLNLTPRYARAPHGQRAHGRIPRNTPPNTTLIAAMTTTGMGAAMVVDGAMDTTAFEVYVEHFLGPTLMPGTVVVLDNLSAHQSQRVHAVIAGAGCELGYLPSYSPDLSPIEAAFSKLKTLLRQAAARTKEAFLDAIGLALGQITSSDAQGYFTDCGYHMPVSTDQ
jgi:transposase